MKTRIERAKDIFMKYCGNRYFMDLDGVGSEYDWYQVPKETEEEWRREYLSQFFEEKRYGKDALQSYSKATYFLESNMACDHWERVLFYPFRCDWLDDVTILFMLRTSLQFAEQQLKKGKLSGEKAAEYMHALEDLARDLQNRADAGTLTRAEDYVMQEFADELYVASYLKDLQQKWIDLSRKRRTTPERSQEKSFLRNPL